MTISIPRNPSTRVWGALALAGVGVLAAGCGSCGGDGADGVGETATGGVSAAVSARPPSPLLDDPAWTRARTDDDPIHLATLAEREGASGLLAGVEEPGPLRGVALAALPYADDGELALARLSELAEREADDRGALLETIVDISGSPRRPRELLDPEGVKACAERMVALAARGDLDAGHRALAATAARRLSEKGYVESSRVPDP